LQSLLQLGLRSPQRKRSSWKKIDRWLWFSTQHNSRLD
jgi:hypothetical protein